ncbi:hypothetical protein D6C78_09905, partial [Aureobasidium pullulans]
KGTARCDCCYEPVSLKGSLCLSTCKHTYCPGCVSIMFSNATKNEASFPPKCCGQEISLKEAACCLHRPQIKSFEQSAWEFNTPVASRRYCANSKCSSFLGRGNRDILRCNRCTNLTCNGCLRYAHPGQCSVDHEPKHLELLGKLAKEKGWQQCSACERFLDKSAGCNHITCPCSHQFCYVCGASWRTCGCPQFDAGDGRFRDVHPPFIDLERLLAAIRGWEPWLYQPPDR